MSEDTYMEIYLPISGMLVNANLLLMIGFLAGILGGLYGISGGIITGPVLIFYGIPSYAAIGAATAQTVGTAFAGTIRNWGKNIDIKIGLCIFMGSFVSSSIGVKLLEWIKRYGYSDIVIACTYVTVFGIISLIIYVDILILSPINKLLKKSNNHTEYFSDKDVLPKKHKFFNVYSNTLHKEFNLFFLISIGFVTGFLSAILGIGGATILVPILLYVTKFPFMIASGTALFQTLLTSINVTILFATYNKSVDMILFSTMLISSIFGVHIGAKLATLFNSKFLKLTLAMVMTAICIKFVMITFIKDPISLFIVE